jgi:hypothetical protein
METIAAFLSSQPVVFQLSKQGEIICTQVIYDWVSPGTP